MRVTVAPESHDTPLEYVSRHYATRIVAAAMAYSRATYEHSMISLREFEGARIRVAQINGCAICQNWRSALDSPLYVKALGGDADAVASRCGAPPGEDFYAAIADWRTAVLSPRERIAIEYAERLSTDPQRLAVDEEFWRTVKQAFSDEEIVDLSYCIAAWMGTGRVAHVLGLDNVCQLPSRNQGAFSAARRANGI